MLRSSRDGAFCLPSNILIQTQIAGQSKPVRESVPYRYQDGKLRFDFALSENDVLLVAVDL